MLSKLFCNLSKKFSFDFMKLIYTFLALIVLTISSCTQYRCTCTDGYTIDVKNSSQKVAVQACEGIQSDRQILSKNTKCSLQ